MNFFTYGRHKQLLLAMLQVLPDLGGDMCLPTLEHGSTLNQLGCSSTCKRTMKAGECAYVQAQHVDNLPESPAAVQSEAGDAVTELPAM